jgi:hypothetical protein
MSIFSKEITRGQMIKASDFLDKMFFLFLREEEDNRIIDEAYERIMECTDQISGDREEWLRILNQYVNAGEIEKIPYMFD